MFYVRKEFQVVFQLRYAISTFRLYIKENTAVQEARGGGGGLKGSLGRGVPPRPANCDPV